MAISNHTSFDRGEIPYEAHSELNPALHAIRERILMAAKDRFGQYGYEATSLTDIAHDAGVSNQDLLRLFDDKHSLLAAVFEEAWGLLNSRFQDILLGALTAQEAARAMLALMMRILERDPTLARLLLLESRRPHPESGDVVLPIGYHLFVRLATGLVARGQKDGSFRTNFSPRLIASMLIGSAEGLLRDRLIDGQHGASTEFSATQITAIFEGLLVCLKP